jgi:hypothetical protein
MQLSLAQISQFYFHKKADQVEIKIQTPIT